MRVEIPDKPLTPHEYKTLAHSIGDGVIGEPKTFRIEAFVRRKDIYEVQAITDEEAWEKFSQHDCKLVETGFEEEVDWAMQ